MVNAAPPPRPGLEADRPPPWTSTSDWLMIRPIPLPARAAAGRVGAVERLEDVTQMVGVDPFAVVRPGDLHPVRGRA